MTPSTASVERASAALACRGGRPIRERLLRYSSHQVCPEDIEAVVRVLQSEWLTTGPMVERFERAVADTVGAAEAVALSSGTAALHAAVAAAGIGPGDEVIVSPLSFCAASNAVFYVGGTPVFADVCDDTLTLDPAAVHRTITPRTKAIIPTDYAGHPAALDELCAIAQSHRIVVIEDACHALGALWQQRKVGSIADLTVFSFHPVKHITTGEGGMVTTQDSRLAQRVRRFRSHGIEHAPARRAAIGPWFYEMTELGYNYRLADINCALGYAQIQRLPSVLARRREIIARYEQAFGGRDELRLLREASGARSAWHLYPVRLRLAALQAGRREIVDALHAEGIGVQVHYIPVHWHPYYEQRLGRLRGRFPIAETAYEELLSLPLFSAMTDTDVSDVIRAVEKVVRAYATRRA